MQTRFTEAQLAKPEFEIANGILRACVHCGFCLTACPTYDLLGGEGDSPRGRIYLIKDMLENERPAPAAVVKHLDRCLSCLSCATACPSGVDYMHLIDHARVYVEETYRRPAPERLLRRLLSVLLPRPRLFRLVLLAARAAAPLRWLFPGRLGAMLRLAGRPVGTPSWVDRPQVIPAQGPRRKRVALLTGCVQQVLAPEINEATARLLARHGCEVVVPRGAGCCGAVSQHLGHIETAERWARRNIAALARELEAGGLDAIVVNASGCGTTVKDYGFLFRNDPALAEQAARISALTRDVSELVAELGLGAERAAPALAVAYHSACSLHHGQGVCEVPKALLSTAGFAVRSVPDEHLCCGSAGTYNLLQPALAGALLERKVANIESTGAEIIAAGNIGCMVQIASGTRLPVVHTIELLDWATGGPRPAALSGRAVGPERT